MDWLITISNDLLENVELSSSQIESLRQERFPAPAKPSKVMPAKGSLNPETASLPLNETHAQAQNEVDLNLSAKFYACRCMLRTILVKEAGEWVMAYHIFGAKINKYGERVLDTIECTIREYQKAAKNSSSSGSNENADEMKRRRESIGIKPNGNDDDFAESTAQSKKRAPNSGSNLTAATDTMSISTSFQHCVDVDLDGCDEEVEQSIFKTKQQGSGRVLPQWLCR